MIGHLALKPSPNMEKATSSLRSILLRSPSGPLVVGGIHTAVAAAITVGIPWLASALLDPEWISWTSLKSRGIAHTLLPGALTLALLAGVVATIDRWRARGRGDSERHFRVVKTGVASAVAILHHTLGSICAVRYLFALEYGTAGMLTRWNVASWVLRPSASLFSRMRLEGRPPLLFHELPYDYTYGLAAAFDSALLGALVLAVLCIWRRRREASPKDEL